MDTILVANAGSSSVELQIFVIEADGGLKRQINVAGLCFREPVSWVRLGIGRL